MREYLLLLVLLFPAALFAQNNSDVLPNYLTEDEKQRIARGEFEVLPTRGITTPPDYESIRAMAEWEEIEALTIAWSGFSSILKQITAYAIDECKVIILSDDYDDTYDYLTSSNAGGPALDMTNIEILDIDYDSIWMRDYAGNTVYADEVGDRIFVDWIYNRPSRPNDNASPEYIADHIGMPFYCITEAPTDLVNTGGNFMTDGFGTGFASNLILEENEAGNPYGVTTKTEAEIDEMMEDFLGIERYIKMGSLPYDAIHHIDMHMKLIDEETILVGEFPDGIADGPQINANIDYVLNFFNSTFDDPYRIVKVPMPPATNGNYVDQGASYRTYSNSVFVNNTIILPLYRTEYDTTAIRIYEEALPGYRVVGIDCDSGSSNIIQLYGAIHCITHSVGVDNPLLISHDPLGDTTDNINPYEVVAYMNHNQGVVAATMYYKTDLADEYTSISMSPGTDENTWTAMIPAQDYQTTVYYYVEGEAADGKIQDRPMPAPEGYWEFDVLTELVSIDENAFAEFNAVYPNPANAITCVPMTLDREMNGTLSIVDVLGKQTSIVQSGSFPAGEKKYFFNAAEFAPGAYFVVFESNGKKITQKLMIK